MLGAFQLNLTALSMVSLLVGTFLIFNTVSGSVARRRTEIGILRSLGTTQLEVRTLFLGEAVLFGVFGIALGAAGGVLLAQMLLGRVAETISSLYLLVSVSQSHLELIQFLVAGLLGVGAVVLGAWIPAREASRVDPVSALSLGALGSNLETPVGAWHRGGAICLAVAAAASWAALSTGPPMLGFVAAFLVLAGAAMFSPQATVGFGRLCATFTRFPMTWRMAADHLRRSVHRNSVTVAALAAAISMSIGLTIMIFSFRRSVDTWVAHAVVADLYVAPSSNETVGLGATISPEAITWLEAQPGVDTVDTFRELHVNVTAADGKTKTALLAVVEGVYRRNMSFRGGSEEEKMARVFAGKAVAVTESFARKFGVRQGAEITLLTPRGLSPFVVTGIYADYTRDQGVILMSREHFAQFWDDPAVQSLAIYLKDGRAPQHLADAFRTRFNRNGEFAVYSNRMLRERILSIFDQTFAVTYVMRSVAILVAVAGIFLSVTTLVAERSREIGVLRAIGAARAQIQWLLMTEAMMIGAIASVLGILAGAVLAVVLTSVVNPAFFGWTIQFHCPWWAVFSTPLWIIAAGLLAAWHPAWRAGRIEIADAVREE